jgi:hypothetical protein
MEFSAGFGSTVILGFRPREAHGYIFLPHDLTPTTMFLEIWLDYTAR